MMMGIWVMMMLIVLIFGLILGGMISDIWGWYWIFFINIFIVVVCLLLVWCVLCKFEIDLVKECIDGVGFGLFVFWVGVF